MFNLISRATQTTVPTNPSSGVKQVNTGGNNPPQTGSNITAERFVNQMWNTLMSQTPEPLRKQVLRSLMDRAKRTMGIEDVIAPFVPQTPPATPATQPVNTAQVATPTQPAQTANVPTPTEPQPPAGATKRIREKLKPFYQEITTGLFSFDTPEEKRKYVDNQIGLLMQSGDIDENEANYLRQWLMTSIPEEKPQQSGERGLTGENLFWIMLLTSLFNRR